MQSDGLSFSDPLVGIEQWLNEARAAELPLPEAMTLATADASGRADARIVLFKGIENRGQLTFYTNYQSLKAREISANPRVCLVFHWPTQERQIRIQGRASALPRRLNEAYFQTRPRESQIGAWASPQSRPIKSREELQARVRAVEARFANQAVPCPPHWGGYGVRPTRIEFWHGRPGRLHDRWVFARSGTRWKRSVLAP